MTKASPAERITQDQVERILALYTPEELAEKLGPVWDKRLRGVAMEELTALGVPGKFDNLNPFFAQHVNEFGLDRLIVPIGTSQATAAAQIAAGIDNLESIGDIARRLLSVGATDQEWRARMIARTEAVRSANVGRMATWKASGLPGLKKRWLSAFGPTTRESHAALHDNRVDLDGFFEFSAALEPGIGAQANVPGDSGVAAHDINCQCTSTAFDPEHGKALEYGGEDHMRILKSRDAETLSWAQEAQPHITKYYKGIERETLAILGISRQEALATE